MNTNELRAEIKTLHKKCTVAEIAEKFSCSSCRVRQLAKRMNVRCLPALGHIEKLHARIAELSKTKTPAQIAWELGISRVQLYSYNQKHGIRCKPAASAKVINYTSIRSKVIGNELSEQECTLNDIRRAGYRPVYAENRTKGKGIVLTGRIIIGNLILDSLKAAQKFAAAL